MKLIHLQYMTVLLIQRSSCANFFWLLLAEYAMATIRNHSSQNLGTHKNFFIKRVVPNSETF
ncbi:hypothetical protein [Zobellia sp. B3R18]|uniref:hypothetical protein n=1 Tax=Zobellia sp. B3R18 TaxID=2841568 RepID=UPI001C06AD40|nr:hypothetical protein [Zobellia sp. B3R18]MBU2974745.1 hypothetical protein [Zobellia sp. B3R18]